MKKPFFLLCIFFMSIQLQAQIYIVAMVDDSDMDDVSCDYVNQRVLTIVDPTGEQTFVCIPDHIEEGGLIQLNEVLNNIVAEGYSLIHTSYSHNNTYSNSSSSGLVVNNGFLNGSGTTFIFAVP